MPVTSSPSSLPAHLKKAMVRAYSRSMPARTQPKANSPWPSASKRMVAGPTKVEIVVVPDIALDDPPAAEQLAFGGAGHSDTASNLGSRTMKAKAQSTLSRPRSLVLRIPPTVLSQPKASSMRLRMRMDAA